jgi:hypothetical protein
MATPSLFNTLFGGGEGDVYGDLLTEEQKRRMQQQSMLTLGAKLLQASGPSPQRVNIGQAVGGALLAGQDAYNQAGQNALTQMLTKQKIEEYRLDRQRSQAINNMLLGTGQTGGLVTPSAAISAPVSAALPAGPTMARANMIGQQSAATPQTSGPFAGLSRQQKTLLSLLKPSEIPGQAAKFMEQNQTLASKTQRQLSPTEISAMGLPPGTIVTVDPLGNYSVPYKPNIQSITTPEGGVAAINLDAVASGAIPTTPAAQRAAGAEPAPQSQGTAARASAAKGVIPLFDPSLKPEQIITESRDWTKNYYSPVQTIIKNYNDVLELINSGSGGISDYGILIKAIKALDPTSAVMQGEADSARNMQSMADRMASIIKQVESGGLGSDVAREQLANLARTSVKTAVNSYNLQVERQKGIYSAGRMPQSAINAILSPIQMPAGAESVPAMRQQIRPAAPAYPPNVMAKIQEGANVMSDGKGNFVFLDPVTNTWKPIQ